MPEDNNLHSQGRDNFKSKIFLVNDYKSKNSSSVQIKCL
jgi:hypothetical protein